MNGRYLLDTSIAVDLLRDVPAVRQRLQNGVRACISITVLGELLFGAERSHRPQENRDRVMAFAADCIILKCDEQTAGLYAAVKAGLAVKGKPIPENDIWIATSAM